MRQYLDPGFTSRATRIPDELYGIVLDNIVVCCVDCMVISDGKMLLGLRTQYPYKGWWVMGGRMRPGELYEEAARRVLEREVGLRIEDPERFRYIDTACYSWTHREQEPQEHGCHTESNNFCVQISADEAARVRNTTEFSETRWMEPKDIIGNDDYHPSIQYLATFARDFVIKTP